MTFIAILGACLVLFAVAIVVEPHGSFELLCSLTRPLARRGAPPATDRRGDAPYAKAIGLGVAVAALSVRAGGCDRPPRAPEDHPGASPSGAAAAHAWGYRGPGAPARWASLSPEFATCATGRFQSPIDLTPLAASDVDPLTIDYRPDTLRISNNGHTVQVDHRADSTMWIGDHPFTLVQYHFHSPSEHTESGRRHAMEVHLVHRDSIGNYAVVAIFIDEGEANVGPQVWNHLPERPDGAPHVFAGTQVDPSEFLPPSPSPHHYQYHGSLTTPPCTETVTWSILATPVRISPEALARFRRVYSANARPVRPRAQWCLAPHLIGRPADRRGGDGA
jgi:carbonic anhydrase